MLPCFILAFAPLLPTVAASQQLPPVPEPAENPITEEKRVLGKSLFWDEQLSSDNTVSCGTCHIFSSAGSDPRMGENPGPDGQLGTEDDIVGSPGVIRSDSNNNYFPDGRFGLSRQVTDRTAPSVIGSQWAAELFWDGRAGSVFLNPETGAPSIASGGALENQASGPPLGNMEMAHEGRDWSSVTGKLQVVEPLRLATDIPPDVAAVLSGGASYPDLFESAFGDPQITAERIAFALATYERTLVPDQTPWDNTEAGLPGGLTMQQQEGFNFLRDHTVCFNCHVPPLFTDNEFYNIGLRPSDEDLGRNLVTGLNDDRGRFKTPTLRNIGLKTEMMHVGWITDVQDSIDFYNAPAFPQTDPVTGHTQYTVDQSGIPTSNPNFFANYQDIDMPAQFQPNVVEFLTNGLTDPRVANETYPFDRPTLHSETHPVNPILFGNGSLGSGAIEPLMVALSPLVGSNPDFKFGIGNALGGSTAHLVLSRPPGIPTPGGPPAHLPPAQIIGIFAFPLAGAGPGQGYATFQWPMTHLPSAAIGSSIHARWHVVDPQAAGGLATTKAAEWTIL